MQRREFITILSGAAAAGVWPLAVRAQQGERVRRIGLLMGYPEGDQQARANVTAFREGLQSLGWIEGRNIQLEFRWAGGDPDKARAFAKELIGMKLDVIVPSTNQVTAILLQETREIPIVFAFVGDPVGSGFITSLRQCPCWPPSPTSRNAYDVRPRSRCSCSSTRTADRLPNDQAQPDLQLLPVAD